MEESGPRMVSSSNVSPMMTLICPDGYGMCVHEVLKLKTVGDQAWRWMKDLVMGVWMGFSMVRV